MVTNLAKMVWERLTLFHAKNKVLPQRVLVYRDGVSEVSSLCFQLFTSPICLLSSGQGQFLIVIEEELPAIKAAFKKFDTAKAPYRPQLTIVICVSCLHFCCL